MPDFLTLTGLIIGRVCYIRSRITPGRLPVKYRRLGSSDLEVSVVGLGTNNFGGRLPDYDDVARVIDAAIDAGVNFLDTAEMYGGDHVSEDYIGRALSGKRDKVIIATKVGGAAPPPPPTTPAEVEAKITSSLELSLKALRTDYVDVFQVSLHDDPELAQVGLRVLDDIAKAGKARFIGSTNNSADELRVAAQAAEEGRFVGFVSEQSQYSLLVRDIEADVLPECRAEGLGVLPYYPLAAGFLTGKYRRGAPSPEGSRFDKSEYQGKRWLSDANFDVIERLITFAEDRGHTIADLSFAWLLAELVVGSVIAGASRPDQIVANAASGEWSLTAEDKMAVDQLLPSM